MNTTVNVSELINETVKGFGMIVEAVKDLEKLADLAEAGHDVDTEGALVSHALDQRVGKVNSLLGEIYKLEDAEVMAELKERVSAEIKGNEPYLVVALVLVGGMF